MAEPITVKVAQLGGKVVEVMLEAESTVEDALVAAEIEDYEGAELRINKRSVKIDDPVFNGELVIVVPKIEGGAR